MLSAPFPPEYLERLYAGVLGKIIGVYAGRPFEGWMPDRIARDLGEVRHYVHHRLNKPLIVTDDDISGTFTFVRALEDHGFNPDLSPEQIGRSWLNYIVERRTILWWGGCGMSTEHTAFLNLKRGLSAPASGSIAQNGAPVAEEIGAQIFIDAWAMLLPGQPERAADFARRAASVSHDGEAIFGAQMIAVMESMAFVEPSLDALLDAGLQRIPPACRVAQVIRALRQLHRTEPDWRQALRWLMDHHGYAQFGTNCPMVTNHGIIILALLYGDGDFHQSLMIVNSCGHDTDCNAGNLGCLLGIRGGLAAFDGGPDWRGPVADRMFLPTADGGRFLTDAAREAISLASAAHRLVGQPFTHPKQGARFAFPFPGAVQGWAAVPPDAPNLRISNEPRLQSRSLAMHFAAPGAAGVDTFPSPDIFQLEGYGVFASPTVYPGQRLRASLAADAANAQPLRVQGFLEHPVGEADTLRRVAGPTFQLAPGQSLEAGWTVPACDGQPICRVGWELVHGAPGTLYLDWLDWDGPPRASFHKPHDAGQHWRRQWIEAVDHVYSGWFADHHAIQNEGRGLLATGTRDWHGYKLSARVRPRLCTEAGIAICYQGLRRYYGLVFQRPDRVVLFCMDHEPRELAAAPCHPPADATLATLQLHNGRLTATWGDLRLEAADATFAAGGIALLVTDGRAEWAEPQVEPVLPP